MLASRGRDLNRRVGVTGGGHSWKEMSLKFERASGEAEMKRSASDGKEMELQSSVLSGLIKVDRQEAAEGQLTLA